MPAGTARLGVSTPASSASQRCVIAVRGAAVVRCNRCIHSLNAYRAHTLHLMSPTIRVGRSREPEPTRPRPRARLTIDELAERTGLTPRTIRSYQTQGILPPPEHRGRIAYYDDSHLERLALVSELKDEGLTLSGIQDAIRRKEDTRRLPSEPGSHAAPPVVPARTGAVRLREAPSTPAHGPVESATPTAVGRAGGTPDRRSVRLATVVLCSTILVALVAGSIILLLTDAAGDRAQLAREISGLRQELSRLARDQGTPTTVVVSAASPPTTAAPPPPPVVTPAAPEPAPTRVITVPAPSPPPTVVVTPPPPPQPTCTTLLLLNRCL